MLTCRGCAVLSVREKRKVLSLMKKLLSCCMSVLLVCGLMPQIAFAVNDVASENQEQNVQTDQNTSEKEVEETQKPTSIPPIEEFSKDLVNFESLSAKAAQTSDENSRGEGQVSSGDSNDNEVFKLEDTYEEDPLPPNSDGEAHTHCDCMNSVDPLAVGHNHNPNAEWVAWNGTDTIPYVVGGDTYLYLTNDIYTHIVFNSTSRVHLCLNGMAICDDSEQAAISVTEGGYLELTDCVGTGYVGHEVGAVGFGIKNAGTCVTWRAVITHNFTNGSVGGGVVTSGAFTMQGGAIHSNTTSASGGGVAVESGGSFTMNNGSIYTNGADANGGAIWATGSAVVTLNGGAIYDNNAKKIGGAVYCMGTSTFNMTGGKIGSSVDDEVNEAQTKAGGVYCASGTTFNLSGGEINGNKVGGQDCVGGGGVYVDGTFTMTGGTIKSNKTSTSGTSGGGVYNAGTFTMSGGTISGNTAITSGGGVFVNTGSTNTFSGASTITDNTKDSGSTSNMYLKTGQTVSAAGLTTGAKIGVSTEAVPAVGSKVQLTSDAVSKIYMVSDNTTYTVEKDDSKILWLAANHTHDYAYEHDDTQHWQVCKTCEAETTHTDHTLGSTYEHDDSQHWQKCTVCDAETTHTNHTLGSTYEHDGSQHWQKCTACDAETTHTNHTLGTTYEHDDSQHWQKCTVCDAESTHTNHTLGSTYEHDDSQHWKKCEDCDAEIGRESHELGDYQHDGDQHWKVCATCQVETTHKNHSWGESYETNGTQHWKKCGDCDAESTRTDHSWGDFQKNDTQHWKVCGICQTHTAHEGHSWGDYQSDGNQHWKECTTCDAETTHTNHTWGDYQHNDTQHWRVCSTCDKESDHQNHTGTATCANKAHCDSCGEEFGEKNPSNHARLTRVARVEPTKIATGNIEYWHCEDCDKYYTDSTSKHETTLDQTILPRLAPDIIEGAGARVVFGSEQTLRFVSDGIFDEFIRVEIDGATLETSNFSVESGSTVVTLLADYVSTLSLGTHTIGIVSENGTAQATFSVVESEDDPDPEPTPDPEPEEEPTQTEEQTTTTPVATTPVAYTVAKETTLPATNDECNLLFAGGLFIVASALCFVALAGRRKKNSLSHAQHIRR